MPRKGHATTPASDEAKLLVVLEGLDQENTVEEVARRHGISPRQYYRWRDELAKRGAPSAKARIRRQQLFDVAAEIFATRGYHATSVEDIAKAMGLTKGSLYYYIDSKEDVLVEIHQRAVSLAYAKLRAILESSDDPITKLRKAVEAHINVLIEELPIMRVLLQEQFAVPSSHRKEFVEADNTYVHGFRSLIEDGIGSGQFRDVDPTVATFLILGMLNWITRWFNPRAGRSRQELADQAADMVIRGLTAAGG